MTTKYMVWEQDGNMLPHQSKMARAALDWDQKRLAAEAGLHVSDIRNFESAADELTPREVAWLQAAFEAAGVEFGDDGAVRKARPPLHVFRVRHYVEDPFRHVVFGVDLGGKRYPVFVPHTVLDDLDEHTGRRTAEQYEASFDAHHAVIMMAAHKAITEGADEQGQVRLAAYHFPPHSLGT